MSDELEHEMRHAAITKAIIGAFFEVYNTLGFGFLEGVYVAALVDELASRGHHVGREVTVRVTYKGKAIAWHRIDVLVDDSVVVECKAGEHVPATARLQLRNYLKGTGLEVGLLLHFGPKATITRVFSARM
jgi:GxxExxY protein